MLAKLSRFFASTAAHRARYGVLRGVRMGWQLRADYILQRGERYSVTVPGWPGRVWLRAGTSDIAVFLQVVVDGGMRMPIAGTPAVIVDAGAHVGLSTLTMAYRFPQARIISIEPDAANYELLKLNTAGMEQVTTLNRALWSGPARLALSNPDATPCSYQFGESAVGGSGIVNAIGVSDLMREYDLDRIDVLKMDIEGAEIEVFGSPDRSWLRRVGMLIVETHDRLRPGCTAAVRGALDGTWTQGEHGEYALFTRPPAALNPPAPPLVQHGT